MNRIFGDRYKWKIITSEQYYLTVIKYILQNPLRALLVKKCEEYRYSTIFYQINNIAIGRKGLGGGAFYSQGIDKDGNFSEIKEVGININAGVEISIGGTFANTKMYNNKTLNSWANTLNNFLGFSGE